MPRCLRGVSVVYVVLAPMDCLEALLDFPGSSEDHSIVILWLQLRRQWPAGVSQLIALTLVGPRLGPLGRNYRPTLRDVAFQRLLDWRNLWPWGSSPGSHFDMLQPFPFCFYICWFGIDIEQNILEAHHTNFWNAGVYGSAQGRLNCGNSTSYLNVDVQMFE